MISLHWSSFRGVGSGAGQRLYGAKWLIGFETVIKLSSSNAQRLMYVCFEWFLFFKTVTNVKIRKSIVRIPATANPIQKISRFSDFWYRPIPKIGFLRLLSSDMDSSMNLRNLLPVAIVEFEGQLFEVLISVRFPIQKTRELPFGS
jgi:hypothetical protein